MPIQSASCWRLRGTTAPGFLAIKKGGLAEIKRGLVAAQKFISAFSSSFSSSQWNERGGEKKSYELFTKKVTLRRHGKKPAASLFLLPPHDVLLSSARTLGTPRTLKTTAVFWDRTCSWIFCTIPYCPGSKLGMFIFSF